MLHLIHFVLRNFVLRTISIFYQERFNNYIFSPLFSLKALMEYVGDGTRICMKHSCRLLKQAVVKLWKKVWCGTLFPFKSKTLQHLRLKHLYAVLDWGSSSGLPWCRPGCGLGKERFIYVFIFNFQTGRVCWFFFLFFFFF